MLAVPSLKLLAGVMALLVMLAGGLVIKSSPAEEWKYHLAVEFWVKRQAGKHKRITRIYILRRTFSAWGLNTNKVIKKSLPGARSILVVFSKNVQKALYYYNIRRKPEVG